MDDCAVIGVPHPEWGETPLAVVVPRARLFDADAIKAWLNARLGRQQRVSAVVFRERSAPQSQWQGSEAGIAGRPYAA